MAALMGDVGQDFGPTAWRHGQVRRIRSGGAHAERSSVMVPAKGLGWPDPPRPSAAPTPEPGGLHRGHAEPEGPELADGPRSGLAADGPSPSADGSPTGSVDPFSEVNGLGWPQNFSNDAVLGNQPLSRVDGPGASPARGSRVAQPPNGTDASGPASPAPRPRPPAPPSPARVQQALSAAVSRETAALSTDGASVSAPIGNGLEDAMPGGTAAQDDGNA